MPNTTTSSSSLDGMKVAILVSDGFEQVEMTEPARRRGSSRPSGACAAGTITTRRTASPSTCR